jgi:F0F1-type ATP synthase membrane subunit b/b'
MTYIETVADIKKRAAKIKTLIEKADMSGQHAPQAVASAKQQLILIRNNMAQLEHTLQQFTVGRSAAKVGPSETK